jgi:elongation factor Ts
LDELKQAAVEKAKSAGKPAKIVAQIVDGVLEKYKNRHVLLRQAYIRDDAVTIAQLLNQAISHIGENIIIRRFVRWEICPDGEAPAQKA